MYTNLCIYIYRYREGEREREIVFDVYKIFPKIQFIAPRPDLTRRTAA